MRTRAAVALITCALALSLRPWTARADVLGDAGARPCDLPGEAGCDADAGVATTRSLRADLRREGTWPDVAERVTLNVEALSRAEAIRRLADAAGWSVIVRGVGNDPVDVRVKDQPAARVLELILAGEAYVAQRDGNMIAIAPRADTAPIAVPTPPVPPVPPPPPPPPPGPHGEDRLVTAGDVTIAAHEVVGNLTVLAGNVDVYGTVNKDLAVYAGNVRVHEGAHVRGCVSAVAGNVDIDEGATVEGEVSGVASDVRHRGSAHDDERRDHDFDITEELREAEQDVREAQEEATAGAAEHDPSFWARLERAGNAVARSALLFAFGAVLLAMAGTRVQRLQEEVTAKPLYALGFGAVGLFAAALAALTMLITVVGLPLAIAFTLACAVGVYVGMCAVLTALGRAVLGAIGPSLFGGRRPSAYLQLAVGCALYLIGSSLPGVGMLVTACVVLLGFGALVRTRAAGLLSRSRPPPAPPPRSTFATDDGPVA